MTLSKSEKMWSRAIRVIPGGNSMVSKNPNMFVPNKWPTYFTKAKGCYVWDLDKRKYTDISLMGVGTNILGYNNLKVDAAVKKTISNSLIFFILIFYIPNNNKSENRKY